MILKLNLRYTTLKRKVMQNDNLEYDIDREQTYQEFKAWLYEQIRQDIDKNKQNGIYYAKKEVRL